MSYKITLVLGGCRSGKSGWALSEADRVPGSSKYFIATSVPTDAEMYKRVESHRKERGDDWQTIEEPVFIDDVINQYSEQANVILVDCLTLWVSNLMDDSRQTPDIPSAVSALKTALQRCRCPVFLVSNEVGLGIVPENKLARQFRDHAGFVNQQMAQCADRVIMTVAGIDWQIKPRNGN